MYRNICLYNNKVFVPHVDTYNSYIAAYTFKKNNSKFEESFKINIPLKSGEHINDIVLNVVENYNIGLKCILILLFDFKGLHNAFIYSDILRKKLLRFALPKWSEFCQRQNLYITDGPSLLYIDNRCYLYTLMSTNNSFDYKITKYETYKVLQFTCFGFFKHASSDQLLLLLILYDFTRQGVHILQLITNPSSNVIDSEELHTSIFFSQHYRNLLKAIEISKLTRSNAHEWKENLCLICTTDDCLIFKRGILKYCCKLTLTFTELISVKSSFSSISSHSSSIIIETEGIVIFISTMAKNCEVMKYWTDVKKTLIGDILLKGIPQVLLLKNTDFDFWQENYSIVDMSNCMPMDLLNQNLITGECLKATTDGLAEKVQIGKTAIEDIEYEISHKTSATVDALWKLNETRLSQECIQDSKSFQDTLVDLVLSEDENKIKENISHETDHQIKILHESQKWVHDHCVLMFRLCNKGEKKICNPTAKLLIKNNQIQSMQKVYIHTSSNFSIRDKCNRQIDPKTEFTVSLCFELLVVQENEGMVFLCWYEGSADEFDNEIFISEEKKVLIQHQMVIQRKLELHNMKYKNEETHLAKDPLVSRTFQQRIILNLLSVYSVMTTLDDLLVQKDFVKQESYENSICLFLKNQDSALYGMYMILHRSKEKCIELEVFAKNEQEILNLINYLYANIPDDVIISPSIRTREEYSQMKKLAVYAIKNELDLLFSSLNIYNASDEHKTDYKEILPSDNAKTIIIPKRNYQRIRKALIKKECITDSIFRTFYYDLFPHT